MYQKKYHIHFVGIGGIGMSGIAELLLNLKYRVSGSDLAATDITENLTRLGGDIYQGHASENIEGADVVVTSSAVAEDNPEVMAARKAAIPVIPRAEMLAELMRLKYSVAIAGAHGKTSTTSLVAAILGAGNLDPTIVIGGKLMGLGTNAVLGRGDFLVAEADESDGSFLKFTPTLAVVTNIDREHLDFYGDLDEIKAAFLTFINRVPFYGASILCLDNESVQDLIPKIEKRFITYGTSNQADIQATDIRFEGLKTRFNVSGPSGMYGEILLNCAGQHSVLNALAGIAVGLELDISFDTIKAALETVPGVGRRMEIKGEMNDITVVDDYGHHPSEIQTTLSAIRTSWPDRRVVVVFQPHRYSRTQALFDEFSRSFYQSDVMIVLPIYAASEKPIEGVTGKGLYEEIRRHGYKNIRYAMNKKGAVSALSDIVASGDLVLTLGAGDVYKVGEMLLERLS
jgi:UDP-N-acetylmuramate--alanine ligase